MKIHISFRHKPGFVTVDLAKGLDPDDQIFSHEDDAGVIRHFHIRTLQALATSDLLVTRPCDPEIANFISIHHNVTNLSRVAFRCHLPGLLCAFDDGTDLIVDGNHRYVWRTMHKMLTMQFYRLPESIWRQSLLILPLGF